MQRNTYTRVLVDDDICLITQPKIVKALGKSTALLLQHLHYWLTTKDTVGKVIDGQRWIYNSYKAWSEMIGIISESTVKRAIHKLEQHHIILSNSFNKTKYDKTKWYTIDYAALEKLLPINLSYQKDIKKPENESLSRCHKNDLTDQVKMICGKGQNDPTIPDNINLPHKPNNTYLPSKNLNNLGVLDDSIILKNPPQAHKDSDKDSDKNTSISFRQLPVHMLDIWNTVIEKGQTIRHLTKKRARFLISALRFKFDNCLKKWKAFCEHIASSQYLMGQKTTWKASLDWVLKFDTLQQIIEGDYGTKGTLNFSKETSNHIEDVITQINQSSDTEEVKNIRLKIIENFGQSTYSSWFKEVKIDMKNQTLNLQTHSQFVADYISTNYLEKLKEMIKACLMNYSLKIKLI